MQYAAILKFLNKYKWWIIAIILAIIIFIIVRRNIYKLKGKFAPRDINLEKEPTDERKSYLEGLARRLYKDIYDTSFLTGHDGDLYKEADGLSDSELLYMSRFYKRYLTLGNSLDSDIQSQWYPFAGGVTELQSHLHKIGEY